jgi:hypothetical protein
MHHPPNKYDGLHPYLYMNGCKAPYLKLPRNLLYTTITRGKHLGLLVGNR